MRLVAEIESIGAMPAAVRERIAADRDRERIERGRRTVARRFSGEHARHVGLERQHRDRVTAAGSREPDAKLIVRRGRSADLKVRHDRHRDHSDKHERNGAPQPVNPRNGCISFQMRGRLAIN